MTFMPIVGWKENTNGWILLKTMLYVQFFYARYSKAKEENTEFRKKACLSLPVLGGIILNWLRTEENELIYTFDGK